MTKQGNEIQHGRTVEGEGERQQREAVERQEKSVTASRREEQQVTCRAVNGLTSAETSGASLSASALVGRTRIRRFSRSMYIF